jgi:hypothetical protein
MFGTIGLAVLSSLEFGSICSFVVIGLTNEGATTVVAPGQMIDNFLTIPDAESLPLYRMVLILTINAIL